MTLQAKLRDHLKRYPDRGWMGRGTYGTPEILTYGHKKKPSIGSFCSIADKVTIDLYGEHPQRVVRYRYTPGDVVRLLKLRWWDQEVEVLARCIPSIQCGDIDELERIISGEI